MIQKATAICSHQLSQLGIGIIITTNSTCTHASHLMQCVGETSNRPGNSAPVRPWFSVLRFLIFPQTKITFEMGEISDRRWDSGNYAGTAVGDWENCVRSQGAYFEGDWSVTVLYTMFLVSFGFFNKCLCFSYCLAVYFLGRPHICFFLTSFAFFHPVCWHPLPSTTVSVFQVSRPLFLFCCSLPV